MVDKKLRVIDTRLMTSSSGMSSKFLVTWDIGIALGLELYTIERQKKCLVFLYSASQFLLNYNLLDI